MPKPDRLSLIRRHGQIIALLAASLASNAPLWFFDPGMDVLTHLVSMSCFSEQFWQGNLYPRWCFSANFSFGSPHLLIYYPLAYFISALLYPLHTLFGVSLKYIFILSMLPPTLLTAFGVRLWLTPVAGSRQATVAAALFLFLPYRQEIMYARLAIGEVWCMAFAPYICHYARRLALGWGRAVWPLGALAALAVLSSLPAAIGVLLSAGLYTLFHARRQPVLLLQFGLAMLLAVALTSPYWLPAAAYIGLLNHTIVTAVNVNSYITPGALIRGMHSGGATLWCSVVLMLAAFLACGIALLLRLRRTPDVTYKREAIVWMAIGGLLVISLFPLSGLFWSLVNSVAVVGFPWRMQLALCLSIIFLFATCTHLRWGDMAALFCLLLMLPPMMLMQFNPGQEKKIREILDTHALVLDNYRPLSVQPEYYNWYWYQKLAQKHPFPAEVMNGQCNVAIDQWQWREIGISITSQHGCSVRLHHLYFPLWRLEPVEKAVSFGPEEGTGLMRVTVPGGHYHIAIRPASTLEMMRDVVTGYVRRGPP